MAILVDAGAVGATERATVAWAAAALPGEGPSTMTVPTTAEATERPPLAAPAWWPWAVGLLLGMVVVGPGLAGGSLLSLDLLVTPEIPLPAGLIGLGPALSQRVPLFGVVGALAAVVGGPVAIKVLVVAWVAIGFAGAARLARVLAPSGRPAAWWAQLAAGVLWAVGPFALTRIGAGHVNLVWVVAVLPWALPRLCRPGDHLPSTFLASVALAVGGPGGGTLGLALAAVGLVVTRPRRPGRTALAVLVPQLTWVLPTVVLLWAGAGVNGAGRFATSIDGAGGWLALPAGGGFWRPDVQAGAVGPAGWAAGAVVAVLAAVGGRELVDRWGWRSWPGAATVAALAGLALAAATAIPVVRDGYDALSRLSIGAPLRESQRFLALWLVWAAPVAAVGAGRAASLAAGRRSRLGRAAPAALVLAALVASVPGWWGVQGRLEPVEYPRSWAAVRDRIAEEPGTAVALPWSEYPSLSFASGRQAFNPLPQYLGGDVISSYDPRFDPDERRQEQVDPRALEVDELAAAARAGAPIGDDLAALGVRWVVLAHEEAWLDYAALADDPGLRRTLALEGADLYEVVDWVGPAVGPDGEARSLERPLPGVLRTDGPAGTVLGVAGAPGWRQGWSALRVTDEGLLVTPNDRGVIWFSPAPLLVTTHLAIAGGAIWALRSRRRRFGRFLAPRSPRE